MKKARLIAIVLACACTLAAQIPARAQANSKTAAAPAASELTDSPAEPSPAPAAARSLPNIDFFDASAFPDRPFPSSAARQRQPAASAQAPSLQNLGFGANQTQADPQLQARLDKRSHMLKMHQRLGLIATVPMIAAVATSFGAGGRSTSTTARWTHLALGSATGDLYFTSAYFAIFAPRIPGTRARGQIRMHKALAWIHGPGMILTPILGAIAFDQKSRGEKVHGIASAHGAVAIVTAAAYGVSILSVSIKF